MYYLYKEKVILNKNSAKGHINIGGRKNEKTGIKALCYTLAAASVVSIVSIVNSDLTALAMEPFDYESVSTKEVYEYIIDNQNKIDIQVIGDIDLGSNIEIQTETLNQETANLEQATTAEINLSDNIETDILMDVKSININGLEKKATINDLSLIPKTGKEQTKAIIVAQDEVMNFFTNEEIVDKALDNGYAIYFECDNQQLKDKVYHKMGIIEMLPTNEDYEALAEGNAEQIQDQLERGVFTQEDLDNSNFQSVASYIIRNMSGEYLTGTVSSNSEKNKYNDLLQDIIKTRKYYTYYEDPSSVDKMDSVILQANAEEMFYPSKDNAAWNFSYYNERQEIYCWYDFEGNNWGVFTSFLTCGWLKNDYDGKYYFLTFSRMNSHPTYGGNFFNKSVYYEVLVNQHNSHIQLEDFGPTSTPSSSSVSITVGADLSANGVGASVSFSFPISDGVTISSPNNAGLDTGIATSDFEYLKDFNWGGIPGYAKENRQQLAFAVASSIDNRDYFIHTPTYVWKIGYTTSLFTATVRTWVLNPYGTVTTSKDKCVY